ncbi:MAG: glycosyltransferase [Deltaproteobacteria bacterium]|nr:glycosyltransferase [Deltaproteobacteria bacterium]
MTDRYDDIPELYGRYKKGLDGTGRTYEFTYILDGEFKDAWERLHALIEKGERIRIIRLARRFGEAAVLSIGFDHSAADILLTLPAYEQIDAGEIPNLLEHLENSDMVLARRWPRKDSVLNRIQSRIFHLLLKPLSGKAFGDIGCGVRVFRRVVAEEVNLYGDMHRFLPLLAERRGFKVVEVPAAQSKKDYFQRVYPPGIYLRRFLDILNLFFLLKFTKKPLRFFGILGSNIFFAGFLISAYLLYMKFSGGEPLEHRPLLLLGVLLIVLGVQIFAIGLIGEIIIFVHAKEIKEYTISQIVN